MRTIDICFSPTELPLHNLSDKVVVVVDILRATSSMCTAIAHGVERIIPVSTLEECRVLQQLGYLVAAERDGKKAEGFDFGNSPFSFMDESLQGKTIAMTTTNGTHAIAKSRAAREVIIGSFLNLEAVCDYLLQQPYNILILCAGWKGKANLEDTLFAGAVVDELDGYLEFESDAPLMAATLYKAGRNNLRAFLEQSSHVRRLQKLEIHKDTDYCLQQSVFNVIPVLEGNALVKLQMAYIRKAL